MLAFSTGALKFLKCMHSYGCIHFSAYILMYAFVGICANFLNIASIEMTMHLPRVNCIKKVKPCVTIWYT